MNIENDDGIDGGTTPSVEQVESASEASPASPEPEKKSRSSRTAERFEVDFQNHRIMRVTLKDEEIVASVVACHSLIAVVARFQTPMGAQVLLKETKVVDGQVLCLYHTCSRAMLGKRKIWETLAERDVSIQSSSEKFLGWLADQLVRASAEAPKLTSLDRAGFHPEEGTILFRDGILSEGEFSPADENGVVFSRDLRPLGIVDRNNTRALFPISDAFKSGLGNGAPDPQAYHEALESLLFCRGPEFSLHLMLEIARFLVTLEHARECSGAGFPFPYFTGPSDAGKSQAGRDLMYIIHGHSRMDEQAYSPKGTWAQFRARLCASSLPQLVNEANKQHPIALVEGAELHDKHLLSIYDGSDLSNANVLQKPVGSIIFTGVSLETQAAEVEKRLLVSEVPSHPRTSEHATAHYVRLETGISRIRAAFVRFICKWSRDPSAFAVSVMEHARLIRLDLMAQAKSMNLNVPSTDIGHYALILAAAKVSDGDLAMHDAARLAVFERLRDRGEGRTFAATMDALKLVEQALISVPRAEVDKDEFAIAQVNASRTVLSISISKARERLKSLSRLKMPVNESVVLRELAIEKGAHVRLAVSRSYPWVEWHRDNVRSPHMRLNGASGISFNFAEDSGMPPTLRAACEEVASRFAICTQNGGPKQERTEGSPWTKNAVRLQSDVVPLRSAR